MIPTAIDFLRRDESGVYSEQDITHAMIEFAKLHCEAQVKAIEAEATPWFLPGHKIVEHLIRHEKVSTSYPLTNIK